MSELETCPFCSEPIAADAGECPYCQEILGPPTRGSVLAEGQVGKRVPAEELDDLTAAYVRGVQLRGAILSGMDLFSANLVAADLRSADLAEANLSNADLGGADLTGANLRGADLSDANLGSADLRGAYLAGADLSGTTYDDFTLWPDGFDPQAAGAIYARPAKNRSPE